MTPEDIIQLYKTVFTTEDGQRVLDDLGVRFCEHSSTFSTDANETAYREGQRTELLFIRYMRRDRPQQKDMIENE